MTLGLKDLYYAVCCGTDRPDPGLPGPVRLRHELQRPEGNGQGHLCLPAPERHVCPHELIGNYPTDLLHLYLL